jgi:hypothetical protein
MPNGIHAILKVCTYPRSLPFSSRVKPFIVKYLLSGSKPSAKRAGKVFSSGELPELAPATPFGLPEQQRGG